MNPNSSVLVIEDDASFVRILEMLNRRWRLSLEFESRREGILTAVQTADRYALVLSDCRVPGFDLIPVLADLRQRRPDLPIVLMSSLGEDDFPPEAMAFGPEAIFSKETIIRESDRFAAELGRLLGGGGEAREAG